MALLLLPYETCTGVRDCRRGRDPCGARCTQTVAVGKRRRSGIGFRGRVTTPSALPSRSFVRLCALLFAPFAVPQSVSAETGVCNPAEDRCPSRFDGVCDRASGIDGCGETGDCFDCDPCRIHDRNCGGCLSDPRCRWCSGDAVCSSVAQGVDIGSLFAATRCPSASDWTGDEDDCDDSDNGPVFSDPEYSAQQWVFDMIDVEPVWRQGVYGTNVHVRVNDAGVDMDHAEFAGRTDIENSCNDHMPSERSGQHGTTVASIMAAGKNNAQCAVGIAPETVLSSCDVILDRRTFGYKHDTVQISQNSWGVSACKSKQDRRRRLDESHECPLLPKESAPCTSCDFSQDKLSDECRNDITSYCRVRTNFERDPGCVEFLEFFVECNYNTLSSHDQQVLNDGVTQGRDGKGILFTFAAGNSFHLGDDINFLGLVNSRLTISVGAVGRNGRHAAYSTAGSALLVSAPGGDTEDRSHQLVAKAGGGCRNSGQGTSFAVPIVSGVLALILEVNPDIGWRDAQGIIAATSTDVEDEYDTTYTRNAAGYSHSNLYGFGIINARAAVEAARTWQNYGPEQLVMRESGRLDLQIPDAGAAVTSRLTVAGESNMIAESVVVYLDVVHSTRGDLLVTLESPSGTISVLHPSFRPENNQPGQGQQMKLMTVRNWGETVDGDWTLVVRDEKPGDLEECADHRSTFQSGSLTFQCADLPRLTVTVCEDEDVVDSIANHLEGQDGLTIAEACCLCGGGQRSSDIEDVLISWKLMVYAHDELGEPTYVPTAEPSKAPTHVPTGAPTGLPTTTPTITPTRRPTVSPTKSPTLVPTVIAQGIDDGSASNVPTSPARFRTLTPFEGVNFDSPVLFVTDPPTTRGHNDNIFDNDPSQVPSMESTASRFPTLSPSVYPSVSSSELPDHSNTPSTLPSHVPSVPPTQEPSMMPSDGPSFVPSSSPSQGPSSTPSKMPSEFPSVFPSTVPTPNPTMSPSVPPVAVQVIENTASSDDTSWYRPGKLLLLVATQVMLVAMAEVVA